ncbi:class I SAM-dependent methyltransferase [Micromonospora sp. NPDC049523]|uniref:class I SAM-dependent methyltransferase n=1 Tax=Micromonospora sp. NPDC049523 TaxID=3155921 RepID=UPI00344AF389
MAPAPDDRVLEIGCGRGVAVSLVSERLSTGKIIAIDRAAAMARIASERNASHISSGRAEIRHARLESANLPSGRFDKIFAVNVNLFWLGAGTAQIDLIRKLLAPGGILYVFGERPTSANATANLRSTEALLRGHGFEAAGSTAARGHGSLLTCVAGMPI